MNSGFSLHTGVIVCYGLLEVLLSQSSFECLCVKFHRKRARNDEDGGFTFSGILPLEEETRDFNCTYMALYNR